MTIAAYTLATLSLLMSVLLFLRIQAPRGFMIWFPKLAAGALSPLWAICGVLGLVFGLIGQAPLAVLAGLIGMGCMSWYIRKVTQSRPGFEMVFGNQGKRHEAGWLPRRWMGLLLEPDRAQSCLKANVPFWTIPGSERELLCDIWQPAPEIKPSGLALIFFHGSAWYLFDKDFGTRPFFSHLVGQGHVVMDVAYRLCPEADIFGMVEDVKRAVAWMKNNSAQYGVDPQCIVLGGASAGGHLSLLAAYAPHHSQLTPEDVKNADLSVRGVVSFYGPSDLRAVYDHTNQKNLVGLPEVAIGQDPARVKKNMRDAGRLDILLGGHPHTVPQAYDLASPISHVSPGCPPTLLIQGEHDLITPVKATRRLYAQLVQAGVPARSIEFPCTDHGFDLMLPVVSPSYQSALYDVDRFLAELKVRT